MTATARSLLLLPLLLASPLLMAQDPLEMRAVLSTWDGNMNPAPVLYTQTRSDATFGSVRLVVTIGRSSNPAPLPPYKARGQV